MNNSAIHPHDKSFVEEKLRPLPKPFRKKVLPDYISILTKSDLVLRDMDILKKLKNVAVGITVTSTDDAISKYFEKNAPKASDRFKALKKFSSWYLDK